MFRPLRLSAVDALADDARAVKSGLAMLAASSAEGLLIHRAEGPGFDLAWSPRHGALGAFAEKTADDLDLELDFDTWPDE